MFTGHCHQAGQVHGFFLVWGVPQQKVQCNKFPIFEMNIGRANLYYHQMGEQCLLVSFSSLGEIMKNHYLKSQCFDYYILTITPLFVAFWGLRDRDRLWEKLEAHFGLNFRHEALAKHTTNLLVLLPPGES